MLQRLAQIILQFLNKLAFLAPLATRIALGLAFFQTGHGKWNNLDKVTQFFASLGIPFPGANATFIALLELTGGLFLVAGLATRLFAFLLSCTMVTAILTSDHQELADKFPSGFTDVSSFAYLLFLLWLLFYGAGPISLDWLIGRFMNRQK